MIRKFISFTIADLQQTKMQMLNWGNRFNICCFLDNHEYQQAYTGPECLLAAGALKTFESSAGTAFSGLQHFYDAHRDWMFGHFSYDLKNEIESLSSNHADGIGFPDMAFFIPEVIVELFPGKLSIGVAGDHHQAIFDEINLSSTVPESQGIRNTFTNGTRYTKEEYLAVVENIREHMRKGDCYELNFCQEFFEEHVRIDPLALYHSLSSSSPNPFSAYYKKEDAYLLCMSPERYLKKTGNKICSQPMKGTAKRNLENAKEDQEIAEQLHANEKERAENIMVVDLVRNDLSKICIEGTVEVEELCAVYSFPQVHQMISTVSGRIRKNVTWTEAIKSTFPMGSMTGAPKKKVMELIEKYERTKRGLFSGSVGYITPENDFDFNVVIRSVQFNSRTRYLSYLTGSAITFSSDPEKEYQECLVKAAAIKKALAETNAFH